MALGILKIFPYTPCSIYLGGLYSFIFSRLVLLLLDEAVGVEAERFKWTYWHHENHLIFQCFAISYSFQRTGENITMLHVFYKYALDAALNQQQLENM